MIRWPENNKVNTKRVATALLIYTCLFVFEETPFTSVWDNLPQTEIGQLICGEEQEESVGIIILIKTGIRATLSRPSISPEGLQFASANKTNSSLFTHSWLAGLSIQRKPSIDYCVFQV